MRDGTVLMADVYRPAREGNYPVLLCRTPYSKDMLGGLNIDPVKACGHGYIVAVQDVRGRFQSEGEFTLFDHEFTDGFDTVQWAAKIPSCDGNVAMWGGSYHGFTQWAAALTGPSSLRTIISTCGIAPGSLLNGVIRRGGARELGFVGTWVQCGLTFNTLFRKLKDRPEALTDSLRLLVRNADEVPAMLETLPLENIPDILETASYMFELFKRPVHDPYWSFLAPERPYEKLYEQLGIPVMHIGGWYDIFLGGTIRQYQLQRKQAENSAVKPMLIIGPWFHSTLFSNIIGEVDFGVASSGGFLNYHGDMTDLHVRWYDATIKGKTDWLRSQSPVQLFVMGENRWYGFDDWPVKGTAKEKWYFHGNGHANTLSGDGALNKEVPSNELSDTFVYDPQNPVITNGGSIFRSMTDPVILPGPRDQREKEHRPDILCYTSPVLEKDYTVIGPCHVELFAASSAQDTDFVACLVDVYPDGKALNVADGIIRASAGDSCRYPAEFRQTPPGLIKPGRVYQYMIDLWATAITFRAGHRIRVEITSSNFPRWDRNLNTGRDGFDSCETMAAGQTVFHNADYPSCIVLSHIDKKCRTV